MYQFNIQLAKLYGVDEAIFCGKIYEQVRWAEANGVNLHEYDGKTYGWCENSFRAFSIIFPFWSKKQLERIVKSCKDKGLVIAYNFNDNTHSRTLWYTVTDAARPQMEKCISPNGEMEISKTRNGNLQMEKCKDILINVDINNNKFNKKEKENIKEKEKSPPAHAYGENGWVKLTDEEVGRLIEKYGREKVAKAIEYIDEQAEKTNNRNGWVSWRAVIQNALRNNWGGVADD